MVTYRSKIGLELIIPLLIIFGGLAITMVVNKAWAGVVILAPILAFITHMLLTTYYIVDGQTLVVKCGFLVNMKIDINTIKSIKETNNALSSPAASLDRLEISYGKYDSVMISPKEKAEFISALTSINPSIEITYKHQR
jgi:hypothetical protein